MTEKNRTEVDPTAETTTTVFTTCYLLRHLPRQKKNAGDKQKPTPDGELDAYATGMFLRTKIDPAELTGVYTSPQPRGYRTANVALRGLFGYDHIASLPKVVRDPLLNDFTTDMRPIVQTGACCRIASSRSVFPELSSSHNQVKMV